MNQSELLLKKKEEERFSIRTIGEIGKLFVVVAMDPAGILILCRREDHQTVMNKHRIAPSVDAWVQSCGNMLITMHISQIAFDGIYHITKVG